MTRLPGNLGAKLARVLAADDGEGRAGRARRKGESDAEAPVMQALEARRLLATVSIEEDQPEGQEGGASPTFIISRDDTSGALIVHWKIVHGNTDNADLPYTPDENGDLRGTVTIPDGQSTTALAVGIADDIVVEQTESFTVVLEETGYVVGSPSSADGTIKDNDPILNSLTGTNNLYSSQTATASGSGPVLLEIDPTYSASSGSETVVGNLTLTANVTPNTSEAYSYILFKVLDPSGGVVDDGSISQSGTGVSVDWTGISYEGVFSIVAGADMDRDGTLDTDEVSRTLQVKKKQRTLHYGDIEAQGASSGNRLIVNLGEPAAEFFKVIIKNSQGDQVEGKLQFKVRVVPGGGLAGGFNIGQAGVIGAGGGYRIDIAAGAGVVPGQYNVEAFLQDEGNIHIYINVVQP